MLSRRFWLFFIVVVTLTTMYLLYMEQYMYIGPFLQQWQTFILTFGTTFFGILGFGMFKLSQGLCYNTFNNGNDPFQMTRLTPCVVSYLVAGLTVSISAGLFVQLLPGIFNCIRKFRKVAQK